MLNGICMCMLSQGFPRNRAIRALLATKNQGVQQALDWLLAFSDTPGIDDPVIPDPTIPPQGSNNQVQQPAATTSGMPSPRQFYPGVMLTPPPGSTHISQGPANGFTATNSYPAAHDTPSGSGSPLSAGLQRRQQNFGQGLGYGGPGSVQLSPRDGYTSQQVPWEGGNYSNPLAVAGTSIQGWSMPATVTGAVAPAAAAVVAAGKGSSSAVVGVAGIMHREHTKTSEAGKSLQQAFQDLAALMTMAEQMVALAERFRGVTSSMDETAGSSGSNSDEVMDRDTQLQLISMGITSPVTKESAGARYHTELLRQLADFLTGPLKRSGGLMMLPDVYCLFNRARGTELVSPDDLLKACENFQQVRQL